MKKVGYTRVSTMEQDFENQIKIIKEYVKEDIKFINEKISTSNKLENRKLFELLNNCENGTTIYITNLDRLARNSNEIHRIIELLEERNLTIFIIKLNVNLGKNMGHFDTFFIQLLASFAQMEKEMIRDRVKDGLKRTKKEGMILGRRKGRKSISKYEPYRKEIISYLEKGLTISSIVKLLKDRIKISRSGLDKYVKENKLKQKKE